MTALHDHSTAGAASPTPLAGGRDEEVDLLVVGAGPAGLYAADHPGEVRVTAVGSGEAATAVDNAATHHLDPDQPLVPGHSSDDSAGVAAAAA